MRERGRTEADRDKHKHTSRDWTTASTRYGRRTYMQALHGKYQAWLQMLCGDQTNMERASIWS